MIFTSFNFLIFFPLLAIIYYITPIKIRWIVLLIGSYFFYINIKPVFALLVAGVTLSTYVFTRLIDKTDVESKKIAFLRINIILILLPLFFFKYFGDINESIYTFLESINVRWPLPEIKLILPIGISFYTFMAIGYTIDVYNEEIESEKNIGIVALFLTFFPLILAGPIERAKNMLPQFRSRNTLNYEMVVKGLKLMLWGYFMKLVVADRLGIYLDAIYDNIPHHNGTTLLFASILYPVQLYADFGGYSLIAIGTAKILGINVMQNFKRPFLATSMSEFWRRWHISLISWLTDYVYTPLTFVFRKYRTRGIIIALVLTFILTGIWHKAALTYIIWAVIQSIFLSIEVLTNKNKTAFENKYKLSKKGWYIFIGILSTFILFAASLIFASASNINEAFEVYYKIFSDSGTLFIESPKEFIFTIFGLSILLLKDFMDEFMPKRFLFFESKYKFIRTTAYGSIFILILIIGVFDGTEFIYFKF